jgi:hypothetical protein
MKDLHIILFYEIGAITFGFLFALDIYTLNYLGLSLSACLLCFVGIMLKYKKQWDGAFNNIWKHWKDQLKNVKTK